MLLLDLGTLSCCNSPFFKKKFCCPQNSNAGPFALQLSALTIRASGQITKISKMIYILYDLDSASDQHPHGKSVGKYVMVSRVYDISIGILYQF